MSIYRAKHDDQVHTDAKKVFDDFVNRELAGKLDERKQDAQQLLRITGPLNALIKADDEARSTLEALQPLKDLHRDRFKEAVAAKVVKPASSTLSITTRGNLVVSAPPYDMWWKTSILWDSADNLHGTFEAEVVDDGYQAAGLAVFLSSTIPQMVRFSADASFHSSWLDWVLDGASITEGGVGVLIIEGGNVIARNDAKLWSDFQVFAGNGTGFPWGGGSGDKVTQLTQTSAGQTYFHMVPGRQYVAWVWCWVVGHTLGSVLAMANIKAVMPFVVVEQQH